MRNRTIAPRLSSRHFGFLPSGEAVEAWTLAGRGGLTVEAITYGGIVTRLLYPAGDDDWAKDEWLDLVLGFDALQPYLGGHPYFGAIIGRVAGRIGNARFTIDGHTFHLPANEPPNHLHGGVRGFDKKIWAAAAATREDEAPSLRLTYCSPHEEEGYPGEVNVSVTYTVSDDNTFVIETLACTDRPTPLSLTHHSYFNLGGEGAGSVADHTLEVCADEFIDTNEDMTVSDQRKPLTGLRDDLRRPTPLAGKLPRLSRDHGALYVVRKSAIAGQPVKIAELTHPGSGLTLTCSTTNTHLQLYIGSGLDGSITGKSGKPYEKYAGLCLECEGYPNGAERPDLGDILLRPGSPQRHTTVYAFSSPGETELPLIAEEKGVL